MRDADYRFQCRRIERLSKVWAQRLGVNWFHVTVYYERDGIESPMHATGWPCLAATNGAWEYMDFSIRWNIPEAEHTDEDDLEDAVIHEFFHVLVQEMQSDDRDVAHEERVVTLLTKAARWTYAAGLREGKKQV